MRRRTKAFTLIELLVVISIISVLTTILMPSLGAARELARSASCLSNLRNQGTAMGMYHVDNNHYFWPYRLSNWPTTGTKCYFWGTDTDPVDSSASPFMSYLGNRLGALWCPTFKWGSYIPQGLNVCEPTTTYGYNAAYLDPYLNGTSCKAVRDIPKPYELFVLADSALYWSPSGVPIFQNSTYLEPVTGSWVQQPTNHFRHDGKTNALCADGHVDVFGPEGWDVDETTNLGFVGTENYPHYEQ